MTGSMPAAATVLYDADCGFCRASVAALLAFDRAGRVLPEAIQSREGQRLLVDIPPDRRLDTAHIVLPDGQVRSGGDGLAPLARLLPGGTPIAVVASALAAPTRWAYGWVARHRSGLSRLVPAASKDRATGRIAAHRARVLDRTVG
jgi:predicted DCC family thiol-disulfide oxidoreductase YuxK